MPWAMPPCTGLDDHRIDDVPAEIVGGDELTISVAGLRVDLDRADVAAGREGEGQNAPPSARAHARR